MNLKFFVFEEITNSMARELSEQLSRQPSAPLSLTINSYGGDVSAALGMCATLRAHHGPISIEVQGVAASSATLILTCGPVAMAVDALAMIHAPWSEATGDAAVMRESAEVLDRYTDAMVLAYSAKLKLDVEAIRALLSDGKDHWFTAREAQEIGLVDTVLPARRIAANTGPLNVPARFKKMISSTELPSAEIVHIQDAAARDALAREQNRRREIKNLLVGPLARRPELVEVLNACLDDITVCAAEASQRLLKRQGEGVESIGGPGAVGSIGGPGAVSANFTLPPGSLTREFAAAERAIGRPVGFGGFGHRDFISAASDALAIRWGARLPKAHPAAQDFQGTGLLGLAAMIMSSTGHNPVGLPAASLVKAVLTTSDFPNLLIESVNKVLSTRVMQTALEHRALCEKGSLSDFKPTKVADLSGLPGLVRKYEAGEITYGSLSDSGTEYKLSTYAIGLAFTREMMINDDLDAIGPILRNTAASGARLERDLLFGLLASNPAMSDGQPLFSSAHGNVDTSGKGVSIEGLNAARVLMRRQKDANENYLLTVPRFIVVPVGHESDAEALIASLSYRPSADTEMQTPEWVRGLTVISDPRLDDQDPEDWYLISDPTVAPVIRLGYLNGRDTPETQEEVDFNTDTLRCKIRFDVAIAATGWAGAVKMA